MQYIYKIYTNLYKLYKICTIIYLLQYVDEKNWKIYIYILVAKLIS